VPVTTQTIVDFLCDESGLELSEYALGAGFMAIAIAMAFGELGTRVANSVNSLLDNIST
jgi:Flp pilus assembly pilin Flp